MRRRKNEMPCGELASLKPDQLRHWRTTGTGRRTCEAATATGTPARGAARLNVAGGGRRHSQRWPEPYRAPRHRPVSGGVNGLLFNGERGGNRSQGDRRTKPTLPDFGRGLAYQILTRFSGTT